MAIETDNGGIMVTGEHIEMMREVTVASGLALEVNTGMVASRGVSMMLAANRITSAVDMTWCSGPVLGTKRTKKGALVDLALYLMVMRQWTPMPSVARALGGDDVVAKLTKKAHKIITKANATA